MNNMFQTPKRNARRWITCCLGCLLGTSLLAQNRIEYFWNNDPGVGRATKITGTNGELQCEIPTGQLPYGANLLGIRALNGKYASPTLLKLVFKSQSLAEGGRVEYFWDNDPGVGKATPHPASFSGEDAAVSLDLPTQSLSGGMHLLGLRAGNGNLWSPTYSHFIAVAPQGGSVDCIEYFWDEDPGLGKATRYPITESGSEVTVSFDVLTEGLSRGIHMLGIRSHSGSWSSTLKRAIVIGAENNPIQAVEYFWDEDPGPGQGTPLAFSGTQTAIINEVIPAPQAYGTHALGIRAQAGGVWGTPLIQIVCVKAVELDENSETSPVDQDTYANEVTTNRTLKAGQWNTLCLPFDLDAEQIAEAGITEVRTLSGVTVTNEAGFVSFTPVNEMEAGKPYLVKVTQTTTLAFGDVWVQAADPVAVVVNGASMEGSYCLTTLKDVYYISNDRFYYADVPVTSKGFRAFIALTEAANVESLAIRLDDPTGIEAAEAGDDGLVDVYTVNGVKLRTGVERAKALEGLPQGIYIVNGKKAVK